MPDERSRNEGSIAEATRRHHYRVACDIQVRGRCEPGGRPFEGRMVNIGLGGANLELGFPVKVPATLHIEIPLHAEGHREETLVLPGTVVWNVADGGGAPYPVGVQFLELDDETRRALYAFVGDLLT